MHPDLFELCSNNSSPTHSQTVYILNVLPRQSKANIKMTGSDVVIGLLNNQLKKGIRNLGTM